MHDKTLEQKITEIVKAHGAQLVDLKVSPLKGVTAVHCLVDYLNGGINLDACAAINRQIRDYLEESKLLGDEFSVAVDSPGLDRKLKSIDDFKRAQGRALMLWFDAPVYGKTYWEGVCTVINEEKISLQVKDQALEIKIGQIKTAKEKIIF